MIRLLIILFYLGMQFIQLKTNVCFGSKGTEDNAKAFFPNSYKSFEAVKKAELFLLFVFFLGNINSN